MKRKRRRLLDPPPVINKVSKDFGGTVPEPLFKYLRGLGDRKLKDNLDLWGYKDILKFSKSVSNVLEDDLIIVLGVDKYLTSELGKYTLLLYTKKGYPDSLILATQEEDGQLTYHSSIGFNILY